MRDGAVDLDDPRGGAGRLNERHGDGDHNDDGASGVIVHGDGADGDPMNHLHDKPCVLKLGVDRDQMITTRPRTELTTTTTTT